MLSEEQFAESHKFIRKMDAILRNRHKLQQIRSDFESYLYRVKDRLENDAVFLKVLSKSEKATLTSHLANDLKWFESAENLTGKQITKTLTELKGITRQPEIRAEQIVKREPALKKLNQTLGAVLNSLNVTWPMFRKWIPEEKMEKLWTLYNSTAAWYAEKVGLIKKAEDWDDPVVMDYEIDRRCESLERLYNQASAIKKPAPPKTPRVPKANQTDANTSDVNGTDAKAAVAEGQGATKVSQGVDELAKGNEIEGEGKTAFENEVSDAL
jgi:hypothetical protein